MGMGSIELVARIEKAKKHMVARVDWKNTRDCVVASSMR